jgi:hypothetical protein
MLSQHVLQLQTKAFVESIKRRLDKDKDMRVSNDRTRCHYAIGKKQGAREIESLQFNLAKNLPQHPKMPSPLWQLLMQHLRARAFASNNQSMRSGLHSAGVRQQGVERYLQKLWQHCWPQLVAHARPARRNDQRR